MQSLGANLCRALGCPKARLDGSGFEALVWVTPCVHVLSSHGSQSLARALPHPWTQRLTMCPYRTRIRLSTSCPPCKAAHPLTPRCCKASHPPTSTPGLVSQSKSDLTPRLSHIQVNCSRVLRRDLKPQVCITFVTKRSQRSEEGRRQPHILVSALQSHL